MDRDTLAALEFEAFKGLIAPGLRTAPGAAALAGRSPGVDPAAIRSSLALADEATRYRREEGNLPLRALPDPGPPLSRLRPEGAVLDGTEVVRIIGVIQEADALRRHLAGLRARFPSLAGLADRLPDLRDVTRPIAGRIAEDGTLDDAASPALSRIRKRIVSIESRIQRNLGKLIEQGAARGWLRDDYVSVRNGRFVVPVRAESRSEIQGIVHGASASGATLFIEPIGTIDLNNDLVTLREEEAAEVRRILAAWSAQLRSRVAEIDLTCTVIGEMDLLGAIGAWAAAHDAICAVAPAEARDPIVMTIEEARHPILEAGLRARGGAPVPLSVSFETRGGVLVLSGPNAGGKTVALKTIGILALMNQAGFPVPARAAVLPVFRHICADIGDHQSITDNLSTFSARMTRVASLMQRIGAGSLVLMDEVGAGTDAEEAGALAVAIVERFRESGAAVVATTHLDDLKAWAETARGALNAAMDVDPETLRPTYRLLAGAAGQSGGIALAERVGLPGEVVAAARARLSGLHRDREAILDRLRRTADEREKELDAIRAQRDAERDRFDRDRRRMEEEAEELRASFARRMDEALESIERDRRALIDGIRDRTIALQMKSESRRRARALRDRIRGGLPPEAAGESGASATTPGRRPSPGGRVLVSAFGDRVEGTLESFDGRGGAFVILSGKRVRVREEDLAPAGSEDGEAGPRGLRLPEGVRLASRAADPAEDVPSECRLLGAAVDEAIDRLDKFLDDAFLAGHARVRIVHGHGTGRLRKAVRAFLATHPHVASSAPAGPEEGGDGATVAVLRT